MVQMSHKSVRPLITKLICTFIDHLCLLTVGSDSLRNKQRSGGLNMGLKYASGTTYHHYSRMQLILFPYLLHSWKVEA